MKARSLKIRAGPSGLLFFNRRTGLTVLLEEAQVPPNQWAKAPRHMSIALTNACDLHCSHCFVQRTPAFLETEQVAGWLQELDANGCLSVGFGGGEPTLHPHFVELCQHAAARTQMAVTFTTHGHRLDETMVASLAGSVSFIRISMDGVGATYEAIRHKPFDALCSRIKRVSSFLPFGINYLVNSITLSDLDEAVLLSEKLDASEFLLLPEQPVQGQGGIDHETALSLCRWVNRYHGSVPLSVSELGSVGLPTCNPLSKETGLRAYAHVDAEGILKRSSFEAEGITIKNDGIMRALEVLVATTKGAHCENLE